MCKFQAKLCKSLKQSPDNINRCYHIKLSHSLSKLIVTLYQASKRKCISAVVLGCVQTYVKVNCLSWPGHQSLYLNKNSKRTNLHSLCQTLLKYNEKITSLFQDRASVPDGN